MKEHLKTLGIGFITLLMIPGTFVVCGIIATLIRTVDIEVVLGSFVTLIIVSYTLGYLVRKLKKD